MPNSSPRPPSDRSSGIRVALVDDDELFLKALGQNLADETYDVLLFGSGVEALDYFEDGGTADIILLDWRMPQLDGIEVLRRLRQGGIDVPVIFLTVLSDQIYEEAALAGGAIDFVEKSRSFSILIKRIQLIVDGRKVVEPDRVRPIDTGGLTHGPLELNLKTCQALWRGESVDLTLTEFTIVRMLVSRAGQNASYREIYDLVRGTGFIAGYGTVGYRANVRAFIKRIRQKFRMVDSRFESIENYPGFGYRWSDGSD